MWEAVMYECECARDDRRFFFILLERFQIPNVYDKQNAFGSLLTLFGEYTISDTAFWRAEKSNAARQELPQRRSLVNTYFCQYCHAHTQGRSHLQLQVMGDCIHHG